MSFQYSSPLMNDFYFDSPPGYPAGTKVPRMRPEGTGSSGILVCSEALGENESADRLPLRPYAEAGSVFERVLSRAGIPRQSLTITNLVWYHPPRNWLDGAPWERDAIRLCQPLNDELIERVKPMVILALGGMAFRELTGMAGEKQGIEMCRGFIVPSLSHRLVETLRNPEDFLPERNLNPVGWGSIPVVGSYHPSFLRRGSKERSVGGAQGKTVSAGGGTQGMGLLGVMIRDIQLALEIAKNGAPKFEYDDYKHGASLDDWWEALRYLRDHPDRLIVYDYETIDSLIRESEEDAEHTVRAITQAQISWRPGQSVVSNWNPDMLPIFKQILELPNPKMDWNGRKFDRPINRDLGIRCDIGEWHDGLDLWHAAQPDLPRGLQFATSFICPQVQPWKHFSNSNPFLYGSFDVDMPQRIFESLRGTMSNIRDAHSGINLWGDEKYGGYLGQVVKLAPVLDRMTERGIPVDEDRRCELDEEFSRTLGRDRYAEYRKEHSLPDLTAEELAGIEGIADKIQDMIPQDVKSVEPAKGYKQVPRDLTQVCGDCEGKKLVPNPQYIKPVRKAPKKRKKKIMDDPGDEKFTSVHFPSMDSMDSVEWPFGKTVPDEVQEVRMEDRPVAFVGKEPKKIPCPSCEGLGRTQMSMVPPGWVRRTFMVEETCECSQEARMAVAQARRAAKLAQNASQSPQAGPAPQLPSNWAKIMSCGKCGGTGKVTGREVRWARIRPFLPNAWQQVLRYIKFRQGEELEELEGRFLAKHPSEGKGAAKDHARKHAKWYVPLDYKSGSETTGEAELTRLATRTGDLVLPMVLEFREIAKLRGTYVQGWKPSNVESHQEENGSVRRVGRVHPSFGFKPATGQLSSENPNAQNFCSHSELAKVMKKMLVASPGHVLVNFDYKSFHVLTLGFEARDPLYMRMARNDMHSFFALCGLLKIESPERMVELPDPELKAKLKWYRKQSTEFSKFGGWEFEQIRNEKSKRAILGIGFGQMERSLYMLNPESYESIAEAKLVLDMLDELFPIPARWREDIRVLADKQNFLTSRHGYIRGFWDVFDRRPVAENYQVRRGDQVYLGKDGKRWLRKPGGDHESCIAFLPANSAFGTIRQVMVKLAERGLDKEFGLINQIHDSLVFDCPVKLLDRCLYEVREEMERPNPYLIDSAVAPEGLYCQAEAKTGLDLESMEEHGY